MTGKLNKLKSTVYRRRGRRRRRRRRR